MYAPPSRPEDPYKRETFLRLAVAATSVFSLRTSNIRDMKCLDLPENTPVSLSGGSANSFIDSEKKYILDGLATLICTIPKPQGHGRILSIEKTTDLGTIYAWLTIEEGHIVLFSFSFSDTVNTADDVRGRGFHYRYNPINQTITSRFSSNRENFQNDVRLFIENLSIY